MKKNKRCLEWKNKRVCPLHIEYLNELDQKGKDFESGPFMDGSGYFTETLEEAHSLAEMILMSIIM